MSRAAKDAKRKVCKVRSVVMIAHANTLLMYLMRLCQRCKWESGVTLCGQVDVGGHFLCTLSLIGSTLGFPQTYTHTHTRARPS